MPMLATMLLVVPEPQLLSVFRPPLPPPLLV
jgi:hypothetical protein